MKIKRILKKVLPISFSKSEELAKELNNQIAESQKEIIQCLNEIKSIKEEIIQVSNGLSILLEKHNDLLLLSEQNSKEISIWQETIKKSPQEIKKSLISELNILHSQILLEIKEEAFDRLLQKIKESHALEAKMLQDYISVASNHNDLMQEVQSIHNTINTSNRIIINLQKENLWSAIFNNTICDSTWLLNRTFSPGRWAMGYPALYLLYRVLEQFTPQHILELGLGQSTKMITQYIEKNNNVEHFVVEHDHTWIQFFKKNSVLSSNSHIMCLEREYVTYKDADTVRVYKNFKNTFQSYKFDLIVVDAPLGGDMKKYSRIDVLSLIENNLREQFVIILDDVNRIGEKNTMEEISHKLSHANIKYVKKIYGGEKETCIWTTPEQEFLCSL